MLQSGVTRLADRPEDFKRFGVDPKRIAPFEDGRRTEDQPGSFEWWYVDAVVRLTDGQAAGVAVVFFTKPFTHPDLPLTPMVSISVSLLGKDAQQKQQLFTAQAFSASTTGCDVRIGANRISGDLDHYRIEASIDNWSVTIDLARSAPSLRIGTGHRLFERTGLEHYFAWLPAVPAGYATVEGVFDGVPLAGKGLGYHDHNWGDADMAGLMHHWYWARATIGHYTVIAARITTQQAYGMTTLTPLFLLENGVVIANGDVAVDFEMGPETADLKTGKLVADLTRYTFDQGDTRYVISFQRQSTILQKRFDDAQLPPSADKGAAYHRFQGTCSLRKTQGKTVLDLPPVTAMWEMMFFGNQPEQHAAVMYMQAMSLARNV